MTYLPSASLLAFDKTGKSKSPVVLAVGNPSNMQANSVGFAALSALPAAGVEAAYIADILPGGTLLTRDDATTVKVASAIEHHNILHFATHCTLNDSTPLLSAIHLANRDQLAVWKLFGLSLDVDLVVLSACQTGQGNATRGDDVVGFTRTLLAAGAHAVLVTLWPVDDLATSLFMGNFYKSLRSGAPAPLAFQKAQEYLRNLSQGDAAVQFKNMRQKLEPHFAHSTDLRKSRGIDPEVSLTKAQYSHPYYWAAFVLIGAWSTLVI